MPGFGLIWFGVLTFVAIVLICVFPRISTAFPNWVMGAPAPPQEKKTKDTSAKSGSKIAADHPR